MLAACDIAITKTDSPDPVKVGGELTYTITVTSEQIATSTDQRNALIQERRSSAQDIPTEPPDVFVHDTLPAGVTVKSITPSQGSCTQSGNTIDCNLGPVSSSDSTATITIVVIVTSDAASQICNTAVVDSEADLTGNNNVATTCTSVSGLSAGSNPTPAVAPTATSVTEDKDNKRKLTELQKLNREKTSTGGFSDVETEGNIVGYRKSPDSPLVLAPNVQLPEPPQFDVNDPNPYILIANVDGIVQVRLFKDAVSLIDIDRLGYYLGADGEKQTEHLFDAFDVDQKRK